MHPLLEYLKSPELVVKVQEYFGIEYKKTSPISKNPKITGAQNGTAIGNGKGAPPAANGHAVVNHANEKKIDDNDDKAYRVTNYFWYVLFIVGTELGDEIFYATFIPFWFWNIDSAVGRRVVMVWSAIMYVGQSLKDIIRWPRPSYPAARLQKKWGLEYGMPSTHAMVSVAIPFSVLIYTYDRYIYSLPVGLAIACVWCAVICVSRVYLGMHSVLVSAIRSNRQ
uniref:Phosphatidic acid phosphatase type 2/haloperoxidase domain-containing protein n=1 Tax=Anopheles maculatus TaxID=74869 RepID=A0A182SVK1_9DIPT